MMRTALFVALCAYSATASDQSRVAQDLDEDLSPEDQVPGPPVLSTEDETAVRAALGATPGLADIVFGNTTVDVTTADVAAKFDAKGYGVGDTKTTRDFGLASIPQITFTIRSAPVSSVSDVSGVAAISVTMTITINTQLLQDDLPGYKTALGLNLAIDLEVLYSQIAALTLTLDGQVLDRQAKTLTDGDVQVDFNICTALGCLGSYTVQPATYTATELQLAAFDRAATAVTFASITTAFPLEYTLANNEVGTAVSATVKAVPEQKVDSSSTNVAFYMGVNVDWAAISGSPAAYKKAWQFAVADRLTINPFRVTDIAFVRMQTTTTVSRRGEAQAIERVNAHQSVCVNRCAPNQGTGGTGATVPPSFSDDDDSSIIAVAVIVPIAVIAIVLVIVWYVLCGGDEEKKDPVAVPYGGDQEQAAGPDQTDEPVPANEDDAV